MADLVKYKDVYNAGRNNTIREITEEEMLHGVQPGYSVVDTFSPYSPESTAGRGDWGIGDNAFLNDADWNAVQGYKQQYEAAKLAGDQAAMNAAHEAAQQVRYKYGYSGGVDGNQHNTIVANTKGMATEDDDWYGGNAGGNGGYRNGYQSMIDGLMNGILNREPFSYNKDTDELYQQYKDSYTRGGQRAMQDVLAQVSARTGGLASSYAAGASQQTYNNYMAQLADKVPELYQMRYNMYLNELQQQRADLDMVMGVDNMYYDRYRDTVGDQQWQQQFDYNAYRDTIGDQQWQQQFDYAAGRDTMTDNQYLQKLAQSQVDAILNVGGTPSAELLAQAGYSGEYASALQNYYAQQAALAAAKGSGSGGSRGSSGGSGSGKGSGGENVYEWLGSNGATDYGTAYQLLRNAGYGTTDSNRYAQYFAESWLKADDELVWGDGYSTESNNGYLDELGTVLNNLERNLRQGNFAGAEAYLDRVAGNFSEEQWETVKALMKKYGYEGL